MKIAHIPKIVFDEEEIKALQTIAHIDCTGIECHEDNCPFDWKEGVTAHCIKGQLKVMMMNRDIPY